MTFGVEESLHIIKIASANCYTMDENIAQILNDINENADGTFFVAAGENSAQNINALKQSKLFITFFRS